MSDTNRNQTNLLSVFSILIAGFLWGTMGLWVRFLGSEGFDSMQILSLKNALTVVLLLPFLLLYQPGLLKIRLKDAWCFAGTGILSLTFFGYCYNRTIEISSLSVAAILLYTAPIFVMLLSRVLFGEMFTKAKLLALLLAFAGCTLVTGIFSGSNALRLSGIITGLCSGFGYALYSIFSRFALQRGYHPFTITFYTFVFSMLPASVLTDWKPLLHFAGAKAGNLLFAFAFSLITCTLPYILYTLGLTGVENTTASIMATVEPVVATILGIVVLGETMTLSSLIGVVLVLTAVLLLNLSGPAAALADDDAVSTSVSHK